jgi:hypothetical protein
MKLISVKILSTWVLFSYVSLTWAASCEDFKNIAHDTNVPTSNVLSELKKNIEKDDLCAKNAYGILVAKGKIFDRDFHKAYSIFNDLAERNYPPAQLNLAILISQDGATDPIIFLDYLLGLYAKYLPKKEWGYVATDARDLGRKFLEIQSSRPDADRVALERIKINYEDSVRKITNDTASGLLLVEQVERAQQDAIVSIISMGASLSSISNKVPTGNAPNRPIGISPFNRIYQVTPMGGNLLYMIPM